jgi:catechol 2,3-dioxygenase-like lactoylglutathione lyase family enzyme
MLHHVEMNVSDLQRSIDFWGWFLNTLGYQEFQRWPMGVSYRLGETYLVFVQTEPQHLNRPYHRCGTGLNHLAFHAASREQVDNMKAEVESRGMTVLYPERYPFAGGEDYYALFFEDPDRIKVELVAD